MKTIIVLIVLATTALTQLDFNPKARLQMTNRHATAQLAAINN